MLAVAVAVEVVGAGIDAAGDHIGAGFIGEAIAVVVESVVRFGGAGGDGDVGVVAIASGFTGAVAIIVVGRGAFVYQSVTVVVEAVFQLGSVGIDCAVVVVAVVGGADAIAIGIGGRGLVLTGGTARKKRNGEAEQGRTCQQECQI